MTSRFIGKLGGALGALTILGSTMLISMQAEAVPAFARQTGQACISCHNSFSGINAFGRAFKSGGYTMMGSQEKVEGDELSIPAVLNASIIFKARYTMTGDDNRSGSIGWPDEAALLLGGRGSENMGYLIEMQMGGVPTDVETNRADFDLAINGGNGNGVIDPAEQTAFLNAWDGTSSGDGNSYAGAKFHFNVTDNFAMIPFSTDGLGVGHGFELMSTGAARAMRPIENRRGFSATQKLGLDGAATGMAFVYNKDNLSVNYTHWAPEWGSEIANEVDLLGGLSNYLRIAYFMDISGWDTGFGIASMSGSTKISDGTPAGDQDLVTESMVIDAQALGQIAGKPAAFYFSYGDVPKDDTTGIQSSVFGGATDQTAIGLLGLYDFVPNKVAGFLGYMSYDTGVTGADTQNDITIGVNYYLNQNIRLELYNIGKSGNDTVGAAREDETILQLTMGL